MTKQQSTNGNCINKCENYPDCKPCGDGKSNATGTEREIWDIVKVLDEGKLTAIEAHKKLCAIFQGHSKGLLNQCLNNQQEIVSSPIRFNGVHVKRLKDVFIRNGIMPDDIDF